MTVTLAVGRSTSSAVEHLDAPSKPSVEDTVQLIPLALLVVLQNALTDRVAGEDRERGDVPGWVLITLMTAGIVTVLWQFAGPRLLEILTNAINGVSGPGAGT